MKLSASFQRLLATTLLIVLAGCASVPAVGPFAPITATASAPTPDPWENWNRKVFAFNEAVDNAVLKPVAQAYRDHVPAIIRTSVNNVLNNLYDVWSTANHFLQGKFQSGLEMGMRVLTNTVLGAGGIMDPATEFGLTRRPEDFGQTLGRWGVGSGPYVVLPVVGPSTIRDTAGFLVDRQAGPSAIPDASRDSYAVTALEVLNMRTNLLATGALVDQVALDKYSFVRDAYLSRRRDALYDGAPPMETFDEEPTDASAKGAAPARAASGPTAAAPAASAASAPR